MLSILGPELARRAINNGFGECFVVEKVNLKRLRQKHIIGDISIWQLKYQEK